MTTLYEFENNISLVQTSLCVRRLLASWFKSAIFKFEHAGIVISAYYLTYVHHVILHNNRLMNAQWWHNIDGSVAAVATGGYLQANFVATKPLNYL